MIWDPDCTENPCTCPGESVGTELRCTCEREFGTLPSGRASWVNTVTSPDCLEHAGG